jgi:N-acetylmuramoyl-L-alanine amidase
LLFTALLCLCAWLLGGAFATPREQTAPTAAEGDDGHGTPISPIRTVVIDAGHGGEDGGTQSAAGLFEKDANLAVAMALRELLEANGIPTVMTRTEDKLLYDRGVDFKGRKKVLDLAARRLIAEETEDCLFVSIHMNAFPQPQYHGTQVWYGTGDPLSQEVAQSVQTLCASWQTDNHRKIKAAGSNIYLLDKLECPAVLVECGFLSNPDEAARLADEAYRHDVAFSIFAAIAPYISRI